MMNILVWKDKHGDYYFDASTPEKKEASALQILRDWLENQYIYPPEEPMEYIQYSGIDLEQANLTDDQIAALPTDSLRWEATKHKKNLAMRRRSYDTEMRDFQTVKRVIAGEVIDGGTWVRRSGPNKGEVVQRPPLTAWDMVQRYSGGEYQEVSEKSVWSPDE